MVSETDDKLICSECAQCNDYEGFRKIVDIKSSLVIYSYKVDKNKVKEQLPIDPSDTKVDVIIIHNRKDEELKLADFVMPEENNEICCPRCNYIMKHAQDLLRRITTLNRRDTLGLCNCCPVNPRFQTPCDHCKEAVRKFIADKDKTNEYIDRNRNMLLSEMNKLMNDAMIDTSKKTSYLDSDSLATKRRDVSFDTFERSAINSDTQEQGLGYAKDTPTKTSPEELKNLNELNKNTAFKNMSFNEVLNSKAKSGQDNMIYFPKSKPVVPVKAPKRIVTEVKQKTIPDPNKNKGTELNSDGNKRGLDSTKLKSAIPLADPLQPRKKAKEDRDTTKVDVQHIKENTETSANDANLSKVQGGKTERKQKSNKETDGLAKTQIDETERIQKSKKDEILSTKDMQKQSTKETDAKKRNSQSAKEHNVERIVQKPNEIELDILNLIGTKPKDGLGTKAKEGVVTITKEGRQQPKDDKIPTVDDVVHKPVVKRVKKQKIIESESESEDSIPKLVKKSNEMIVGENIVKMKPFTPPNRIINETVVLPNQHEESEKSKPKLPSTAPCSTKADTITKGSGITKYALSDPTFIDKGWTKLPTRKVVKRMNVFRMRPIDPELNWFERHKNDEPVKYETGENLSAIEEDGRGRWYYKNGRLALDYYVAEEQNAGHRYVVYSNGEPDERGRTYPISVLATFDHLGNGIVFDHSGKIRLKYNQTEGVVLDRTIGPVTHWQWHSLNDPPVLQQVMIDTVPFQKDPNIAKLDQTPPKVKEENEAMLNIEFENVAKEKHKKMQQAYKPFQIQMKALKINNQFSLKVLDQSKIHLIFRDGSINIKLNLGMLLDHHEIIDTVTTDVGDVHNSLTREHPHSDSLVELKEAVHRAQTIARVRSDRNNKLKGPIPSDDKFKRVISRPLQPPILTMTPIEMCYCRRKPLKNNVYYNNVIV